MCVDLIIMLIIIYLLNIRIYRWRRRWWWRSLLCFPERRVPTWKCLQIWSWINRRYNEQNPWFFSLSSMSMGDMMSMGVDMMKGVDIDERKEESSCTYWSSQAVVWKVNQEEEEGKKGQKVWNVMKITLSSIYTRRKMIVLNSKLLND